MKKDVIKFYEGKFASLSNFSAHQVKYKGVLYATAEHAYQCQKFSDLRIKKKIKLAKSAFLAREYGQEEKGRKKPFDKVVIMKEIMKAKLFQHDDVKGLLLSTGNMQILKNHPLDAFWGTGKDGKGKNIMGKIWIEIRKEIS